MSSQSRQYHWDFARAFYLLLGIPFHSAVVYSTHFVWSVSSPERSPLLTFLADTIHIFRMPGFFILAGYFSMMILLRQGARVWVGKRIVRLGVPLLTATLLILPLQIVIQQYALTVTGALAPQDLVPAIVASLTHFDEPWISHLWFLWCLIAYSVGLAAIVGLTGAGRIERAVAAVADFGLRHRWLAFAILAAVCAVMALVLPELYRVGGARMPAAVAYNQYAVYFYFGAVIFVSRPLRAWYSGAGLVALAIGLLLGEVSLIKPVTPWSQAVFMISGVAAALLITGFITSAATTHFNRPNAMIRKVVGASFTIYLFHHPVIFVLATIFLTVDWPPVVEFLVILSATALITYGIHGLIARSPRALFLFNGTSAVGPRPVAKVAGEPAAVPMKASGRG